MTSRERMLAILAGERPDRIAVYEHWWGETLPAWREQGFPAGVTPDQHFDYDLQSLGWGVDTAPFRGASEVLEEDDRRRVIRDGRGATLRYWKAKSGTPEHLAFDCATPADWLRYKEPLLELDPARVNTDALAQALAAGRQGDKLLFMGNLFIFELLRGTLGDVVMMESLLLEPAWIHDFCRTYTDFYKRHYAWLFDNVGRPDAMFIYEDLGYSHGPFCSPATFNELLAPYHTELVAFFRDYDLPSILHSCGDVRAMFPTIQACGWACLQPMEAKAGNHVLDFADQTAAAGARLGFMGNIDVTVLNTGNRDAIAREVRTKVGGMVARGAGYCFHSDHSIPPDVGYEDYRFAVEVARECGTY